MRNWNYQTQRPSSRVSTKSNEQSSVSFQVLHSSEPPDHESASSDEEGYEHALTIARLEAELAEIIQSVSLKLIPEARIGS